MVSQIRPTTCRTHSRYRNRISAIMTSQLVHAFMISQTHITILAFRHPCTSMTFEHRRKTSSVLKQNDLFFIVQRLADFFHQHRRERPFHSFLMGKFLNVHFLDMWQLNPLIAFFQFYQSIFTGQGIEIAFHIGRSSSQQHLCTIHRGQHNCSTTGMVAWRRFLLLISVFMFFVHDY